MSPSNGAAKGAKRKVEDEANGPSKKTKGENSQYKDSTTEEEYGIIDREFYPPEMTNERCHLYNSGDIARPIDTLSKAQKETQTRRDEIPVKEAVIHWFKNDLRTKDNKALHLASEKAKSKGVPLICLHIISPQDYKAHITSAVRVDFGLRTLEVLKEDLAALDIPLYVETIEKRRNIPDRILELCDKWNASHLYCNIEYEVDELRREALITEKALDKNIAFYAEPDTCVVSPGELTSGKGTQYAVYSPWFRAWVSYLHTHPHHLTIFDPPSKNASTARTKYSDLYACPIPPAPANSSLTPEEKTRFAKLWPPGEHKAHDRLTKFVSEKIRHYKDDRNTPSLAGTSSLSVHFASGTLSARSAISAARAANSTQKLDGGSAGITTWISEVAWRDFYKHILAHWPYVCMNKPFKPEYTDIKWEYDRALFEKWTSGTTGYPYIDAAMRQLNHTGYMHNRARMGVASFLAKDLLLDWRMGERYFMSKLIDGDFASNNGGWGFSASTGVDPQPYFRIFNPILQGERFDANGEYIRKWVPELKGGDGEGSA